MDPNYAALNQSTFRLTYRFLGEPVFIAGVVEVEVVPVGVDGAPRRLDLAPPVARL